MKFYIFQNFFRGFFIWKTESQVLRNLFPAFSCFFFCKFCIFTSKPKINPHLNFLRFRFLRYLLKFSKISWKGKRAGGSDPEKLGDKLCKEGTPRVKQFVKMPKKRKLTPEFWRPGNVEIYFCFNFWNRKLLKNRLGRIPNNKNYKISNLKKLEKTNWIPENFGDNYLFLEVNESESTLIKRR